MSEVAQTEKHLIAEMEEIRDAAKKLAEVTEEIHNIIYGPLPPCDIQKVDKVDADQEKDPNTLVSIQSSTRYWLLKTAENVKEIDRKL